jgi:hypothetical protein
VKLSVKKETTRCEAASNIKQQSSKQPEEAVIILMMIRHELFCGCSHTLLLRLCRICDAFRHFGFAFLFIGGYPELHGY